jgi:hypothetical protein
MFLYTFDTMYTEYAVYFWEGVSKIAYEHEKPVIGCQLLCERINNLIGGERGLFPIMNGHYAAGFVCGMRTRSGKYAL